MPLLARVRRVGQVLVTRLDPLHRRVEAHREQREQDLLGVDLLLHAEAAAHVGRDHADPVLAEPERLAKRVAQGVRPLGGRPHGEATRPEVVVGEHAARFQRHPGVAMDVVAPACHHFGAAERSIGVAGSHGEVGGDVARDLVVQESRARCDRRMRVRHGVERLVRDLDGRGSVLSGVAALRHDGDDRLADVANLATRQRELPAWPERRVVDDARDLAEAALGLEIGRGENVHDLRDGARRGEIDLEGRVRVDAADERHVTGPRHAQVVDVARLTAQEPRIFEALQGSAGKFVGHVVRRGAPL